MLKKKRSIVEIKNPEYSFKLTPAMMNDIKEYNKSQNDKNGYANFNTKGLKVGTHKVVVSSGNIYCTAKSVTSSIKINK